MVIAYDAANAQLGARAAAHTTAELAAIRGAGQEDFYFYQRYMFAKMRGYQWKRNWHHKVMCDALMEVYRGECNRLIINVPPRYSKTETAVVNWTTWCLGKVPDAEFIHVSYGSSLAENNSANAQAVMSHESYRDIFETELASSAKGHWRTTDGGVFYSTGSGGPLTGFGAGKLRDSFGGAIIIDDPHKPDEAASDTMRNHVINWYQSTLQSRTNNPNTPIVLIMQRLHEADLAGWLLAGGSGEEWKHVCIPVLDEHDTPLWPWKHDRETLKAMEKSMPYVFAGQYMQRPAPLGGGIFKTAWWSWFNPAAAPRFRRIIQSWDTAFKTKEANDFSVCTTWGETDTGYYLLDIWKDKVEFPDLKRMVVALAAKWNPHGILVEDKASGQSLIQDMRAATRLPIIPIRPTVDKVARANLITPIIEAGKVFLPEGHPEVPAFVISSSQFPNAAHDDDIDSVTQYLGWATRGADMSKVTIGGI